MTNQSPAQNINQDIDTNTIIVHWKMRNGKTLVSWCMALDFYPRIYCNFQIYRYNKSIVNYITTYEQIKNIRFSYKAGVLVIDEAWLNANSKDTFSKDNRILQEVLFLIGKKNLSLIWIAQRYKSIDINARELADLIIEMKKIRRKNKPPIFIATKQRQKGDRLIQITQYSIDTIGIFKALNITYNQLEESKLTKTKNLEEGKTGENYITNSGQKYRKKIYN